MQFKSLRFIVITGVAVVSMLTGSPAAHAGMPAMLPEDIATVMRLTQPATQRLQAISFFAVGVALSALAVKLLWNYLTTDFTRLPKLTYTKALSLTVLWGLLFVIVLTMISGARELMTPEAWQKNGVTYKPVSESTRADPRND